jgi:ribosomal protein S14
MKALIRKNQLIRDNYKNNELGYFALKAMAKSNILTPLDKDYLLNIFLADSFSHPLGEKKPNNQNQKGEILKNLPQLSKVRNICVSTGRTRALVQDYKLARNSFKNLAELGYIPGVKKR